MSEQQINDRPANHADEQSDDDDLIYTYNGFTFKRTKLQRDGPKPKRLKTEGESAHTTLDGSRLDGCDDELSGSISELSSGFFDLTELSSGDGQTDPLDQYVQMTQFDQFGFLEPPPACPPKMPVDDQPSIQSTQFNQTNQAVHTHQSSSQPSADFFSFADKCATLLWKAEMDAGTASTHEEANKSERTDDVQMQEPVGSQGYRILTVRGDFLATNPFFGANYKLTNPLRSSLPKNFSLDGNKFKLLTDTFDYPADLSQLAADLHQSGAAQEYRFGGAHSDRFRRSSHHLPRDSIDQNDSFESRRSQFNENRFAPSFSDRNQFRRRPRRFDENQFSRQSENRDQFRPFYHSSRQRFKRNRYQFNEGQNQFAAPFGSNRSDGDHSARAPQDRDHFRRRPHRSSREPFEPNRYQLDENQNQFAQTFSNQNRSRSIDTPTNPPIESNSPSEQKPTIDFSTRFGQPDSSVLLGSPPEKPAQPTEAVDMETEEAKKSPADRSRLYGGDDLLISFFSTDRDKPSKGLQAKKGPNQGGGPCESNECDCFSGKQSTVAKQQKPADDFVSFQYVLDLQVKFGQLQAWLNLKSLRDAIVGCFVRVPIDEYYMEFAIAQIIGLVEGDRYPVGRQQTNVYLILFVQESISEQTPVRINFISNNEFTREEFGRWSATGRRANGFELNRQHYDERMQRLQQIRNEHEQEELKRRSQSACSSSDEAEDAKVEWDRTTE